MEFTYPAARSLHIAPSLLKSHRKWPLKSRLGRTFEIPTSKHSKGGRSWLTFLRLEGRLHENPDGRRLRPTRAKILTPLPGTAGVLAVFGGPPKCGRYVYGFQRVQKKQPIRLRYLAGPKITADTFTVFTTSPTSTSLRTTDNHRTPLKYDASTAA